MRRRSAIGIGVYLAVVERLSCNISSLMERMEDAHVLLGLGSVADADHRHHPLHPMRPIPPDKLPRLSLRVLLHGTSEQFHAEYKTDLGMEQFPSADYRVNRVLFLLGCLVFNALRQLGQESLRTRGVDVDERAPIRTQVKRRRLRSVIDDLIRLAGRVVHTGHRHILSLGCGSPWIAVWLRLHRTCVARLVT
ncbi:MAG: hypothetical protein H0V44_14055 [Planctomycetes bacterium]|nr:hypothetical protein [Planctomycetota bacterium]